SPSGPAEPPGSRRKRLLPRSRAGQLGAGTCPLSPASNDTSCGVALDRASPPRYEPKLTGERQASARVRASGFSASRPGRPGRGGGLPRDRRPPADLAPLRAGRAVLRLSGSERHGVADRGARQGYGAVVTDDRGAELGDRLVGPGLEDLH